MRSFTNAATTEAVPGPESGPSLCTSLRGGGSQSINIKSSTARAPAGAAANREAEHISNSCGVRLSNACPRHATRPLAPQYQVAGSAATACASTGDLKVRAEEGALPPRRPEPAVVNGPAAHAGRQASPDTKPPKPAEARVLYPERDPEREAEPRKFSHPGRHAVAEPDLSTHAGSHAGHAGRELAVPDCRRDRMREARAYWPCPQGGDGAFGKQALDQDTDTRQLQILARGVIAELEAQSPRSTSAEGCVSCSL